MISLNAESFPQTLKFPTLIEQSQRQQAGAELSLTAYYQTHLLAELNHEEGVTSRSLESDRNALRHWEKHTDSPPVGAVTPAHLEQLRDGMKSQGCRPATINKVWRECRAMLAAAADDGFLSCVPKLEQRRRGKKISCRLCKEPPTMQRQLITEEELERLWLACRYATYPSGGQFPAPLLWRVSLVLFWTYGPRTLDVFSMRHSENIRLRDKLIKFTAQKTQKLQGLPITPIVDQHLRSIKGHAERLFPGFNYTGSHLVRERRWKPGYYTTWRKEICAAAGLVEPVLFKNFRQRVVTKYDAIQRDLGKWIAGHFIPGVSAQNYALPTDEIRHAICSAPVPECFYQIG